MDRSFTLEELVGPLSATEAKGAPSQIWLRGDPSVITKGLCVAIVGSREASPAGLKRAEVAAQIAVQLGYSVISGLAVGIDKAAHRAAMIAKGRTAAVLGTPLSDVYPKEHAELHRYIGQKHLLISQFAEGTKTDSAHFPARNRLMALLSHCSIVVEAQDASGTLSHAKEALRLKRPLFIMASNFEDKSLKWPMEFEKKGAFRVSTAAELRARLALIAKDLESV